MRTCPQANKAKRFSEAKLEFFYVTSFVCFLCVFCMLAINILTLENVNSCNQCPVMAGNRDKNPLLWRMIMIVVYIVKFVKLHV